MPLVVSASTASIAVRPSVKRLPPICSRYVKSEWVVYAKRPFGGPDTVLAYLSRYTHRVAIANHRLIAADANTVSFRYKDYRIDGPARHKVMTLATTEFIRRFLMHVLPKGFHRIRQITNDFKWIVGGLEKIPRPSLRPNFLVGSWRGYIGRSA